MATQRPRQPPSQAPLSLQGAWGLAWARPTPHSAYLSEPLPSLGLGVRICEGRVTGGPTCGAGSSARVCEPPAVPLERPADVPGCGPRAENPLPTAEPLRAPLHHRSRAGSESSS